MFVNIEYKLIMLTISVINVGISFQYISVFSHQSVIDMIGM